MSGYEKVVTDKARLALLRMVNAQLPKNMRVVGLDRTLERGEVIVYAYTDYEKVVQNESRVDYAVAPIDGYISRGCPPSGLRPAPMGTAFAAKRALSGEGYHSGACSIDFHYAGGI